jgi:hypothetical protein
MIVCKKKKTKKKSPNIESFLKYDIYFGGLDLFL